MDFDTVNLLKPEAETVKLTSYGLQYINLLKPEDEGALRRQYKKIG
jgi:hypothetical protein